MEEFRLEPQALGRKEREYVKYAYSLKISRVREKDFPYYGNSIRSTKDLVKFCRSLECADIEKLVTIYLNVQNDVIGIHAIPGTVNQATAYPREIFKNAFLFGASAIILVHNHPSGHVKPSDADIRLTRSITSCAKVLDVLVHDHMIIGEGCFFSMREEGLLEFN